MDKAVQQWPMQPITQQTIAAAKTHLADCTLCPHLCGDVRATAKGKCRVGPTSYVASEMMHMGEEELLHPAHAIFFSGCTATCHFCTAARFAFQPTYGVAPTPAQLAKRILQRQAEGARSLCFIGGDPAPHIPFILETLSETGTRRTIPTVFNSNFYLTDAALDLLRGAIDIYLPDLKFGPSVSDQGMGNQGCGERIGGMPNYWPTVTHCIERVWQAGERVVVRHLLMPGHLECCTRPVLHWLAEHPGIETSLLTQYLAHANARAELAAPLAQSDIDAAFTLARHLGLRLVQ